MAQEISSFRGRHRFLSNFQELPIEFTTEHIFQALKCEDWEEMIWVLLAPDPATAKRRGRKVKMREDWDDIRISVMDALQAGKFEGFPVFRHLLIETGEADLIEGNTWGDKFWGAVIQGGRWVGKNHLGKSSCARVSESERNTSGGRTGNTSRTSASASRNRNA